MSSLKFRHGKCHDAIMPRVHLRWLMPIRHYHESIEVFLIDMASRYTCHARKQERLNMKTHPSPVATALEPEEKSTDRTVRYQLPGWCDFREIP
jgi:hypothetical protein